MSQENKNIVIGITGASGSIYAKSLIDKLTELQRKYNFNIHIVITKTGEEVIKYELEWNNITFGKHKIYNIDDFYAPFASGSSVAEAMIVVPCSMGTLGRIAHGTSDNLLCRAADVILKEKKKLILVTRETPLNLIHIKNMERVTLAGGIIFPANPSFYMKPQSIDDLINSIISRILDLLEIEHDAQRWG
ncbi:MAG: hypothetical protein C0596_07635 [Marinilabiliales bacterium]|nr:MAG: hypothetical protein C0596_07635 [Marinilabiliales bacterium]